jgi:hypothetical protein
MDDDIPTLVIDLNQRITPTEIRIQMVEPDGHFDRDNRRSKPRLIYEKHGCCPHSHRGRLPASLQRIGQKLNRRSETVDAKFHCDDKQGLFDSLSLRPRY